LLTPLIASTGKKSGAFLLYQIMSTSDLSSSCINVVN